MDALPGGILKSSGGIFSPENLQKHVTAAMGAIPPGKTMAGIGYYNLEGQWRVGLAYRSPDGAWTFMGHVGQDIKQGNLTGGFQVTWTH